MTRRRKFRGGTLYVTTSYEDPDTGDETDVTVECGYTPGERATGPTFDSGGYPGSAPEVELLGAEDDAGNDWLERIEADEKWRERIEEKAIEAASEVDDEPDGRREERDWR